MNKYFIQLFLEENTVIIPELGALTKTNEQTGEIMFLPYLKYDDGRLAEFISKTEGVEKVDAMNMISKFVREINLKLDQGDSYDIFEFGSFFKNSSGEIEFKSVLNNSNSEPVMKSSFVPPVVEEAKIENTDFSFQIEEPEAIEEVIEEVVIEPSIVQDVDQVDDSFFSFEPGVSSEDLLNDILQNKDKSTEEVKESEFETPISLEVSTDEIPNQEESIEVPAEEEKILESPIESIIEAEEKESVFAESREETAEQPIPFARQIKDQKLEENVLIDKAAPKRKRFLSFPYILLYSLLTVFTALGVWSYFNFDKVKEHIPFLSEKKDEYKSILNSDDEHIKVMKELSGMLDSTDVEIPDEEGKPTPEPKKDEPVAVKKEEKPVVIKDAKPTAIEPAKTLPKAEKPVAKKAPAQKPATTAVGSSTGGSNHIIIGSFGSAANAENLASKLKKSGFKASTIVSGSMTMVSAGSFATVEEAQSFLSKNISSLGKGWIYKQK